VGKQARGSALEGAIQYRGGLNVKNARVRVGLAGAVHPNMPGDDEGLYSRIIEAVGEIARAEDFDFSVFQKPLRSEADGEAARAFMDGEDADFILLFNASLPYGRVILPLAKAKGHIGLWSVPEPQTSGVLQLNSFCGTNMLGSIIANYLREYCIPYKWFYGMPDQPRFRERLSVTLSAMRAMKALRTSRIAQIGGLADGFENLYIDERILERKFGTQLQTRHTVEEIVARAEKLDASVVRAEVAKIGEEGSLDLHMVSDVHAEKSARVYLALKDFAQENNYDSLALSCWSRFQQVYGVAVCAAMSRLNEEGIATPCEADVTSAVMMLALNAMNGKKAALSDLVAFDESDQSLSLWHCGVAPASWADQSGVRWDNHFNIGHHEGCTWCGDGLVADMRFKAGSVTIASLDNDFDNLLILSGQVAPGKQGYAGSGGWVNDLRLNGESIGIEDLMNTIVVGRVNHHYPSAFGDLTNELNEFAAWNALSLVERVPYAPYLQLAKRSR
jgi:L-fucose isomerase-like protein